MLRVAVDRKKGRIKFWAFGQYEAELGEMLLNFIYLNLSVTLFDDSYILKKKRNEIEEYFKDDNCTWSDKLIQAEQVIFEYHPYLCAEQAAARRLAGTAFKEYFKDTSDEGNDYNRLAETQNRLLHAVSYIFDIDNEEFKDMKTAIQKYYAYVRFISNYEGFPVTITTRQPEKKIFTFGGITELPKTELYCSTPHEDQIKDIKDVSSYDDFYFYEEYICDSIEKACFVELYHMIINNVSVKKCRYCGKYFLNNKYKNSLYCNRIPEGETKPCNIIAPRKNYEENLKSNEIAREYRKRYKTLFARIKNSPSPEEERKRFEKWKEWASTLRDEAIKSNMELETFKCRLEEIERGIRCGQH